MFSLVIVLSLCIINLSLGMFVLMRNPRQLMNIIFSMFCLFASLWAVSNYITDLATIPLGFNALFNRGAFFCAFVAVELSLWFSFLFPVPVSVSRRVRTTLIALATALAIFSATDFVDGTVSKHGGRLSFSVGAFLPLYVAVMLATLLGSVINLWRTASHAQGREKQQAVYMLVGFSVPVVIGLVTNAIVPIFTSSWQAASIGPSFTVIFVAATTYAIIRHRLFDIRLAIARSLAYVLSVLTVVVLYIAVAFGLLDSLFNLHINFGTQLMLGVFSAMTALAFQPLKRRFNKITNAFFYQDAYDPQQLLNTLNHTLVATADLRRLLNGTLRVIADNLKTEFAMIVLQDPQSRAPVVVGSATKAFEPKDLKLVHSGLLTWPARELVVVTDNLAHEDEKLRGVLLKNEIALIARVGGGRQDLHELGHIILGPKKSGNPYSGQDIRVMETIANELVIAIQNALRFEEIQAFNATLQEKIADATRKLRSSNDKLRKLDQTKDDFISMASHQLRTPLTSVKGYVSMVLDGDAGPLTPLQNRLLNQSFISAQRMVYLISDLLNVSRLRTGKFIVERAPTNLANVVKDEIGQLVETAKSRGLELTFVKPEHFPTLMLDETKMRQVIMNFMDNAIYYTPSGGHIAVQLVDRPEAVEFTVTDDGIGVPRHEQPHMFTKFYRAANAKRARPDGTGLGLFMAKKVIIAQGGAVIFKSVEGKGSTFGFTFAKAALSKGEAKK